MKLSDFDVAIIHVVAASRASENAYYDYDFDYDYKTAPLITSLIQFAFLIGFYSLETENLFLLRSHLPHLIISNKC